MAQRDRESLTATVGLPDCWEMSALDILGRRRPVVSLRTGGDTEQQIRARVRLEPGDTKVPPGVLLLELSSPGSPKGKQGLRVMQGQQKAGGSSWLVAASGWWPPGELRACGCPSLPLARVVSLTTGIQIIISSE